MEVDGRLRIEPLEFDIDDVEFLRIISACSSYQAGRNERLTSLPLSSESCSATLPFVSSLVSSFLFAMLPRRIDLMPIRKSQVLEKYLGAFCGLPRAKPQ
jgi:hypothetical protein